MGESTKIAEPLSGDKLYRVVLSGTPIRKRSRSNKGTWMCVAKEAFLEKVALKGPEKPIIIVVRVGRREAPRDHHLWRTSG